MFAQLVSVRWLRTLSLLSFECKPYDTHRIADLPNVIVLWKGCSGGQGPFNINDTALRCLSDNVVVGAWSSSYRPVITRKWSHVIQTVGSYLGCVSRSSDRDRALSLLGPENDDEGKPKRNTFSKVRKLTIHKVMQFQRMIISVWQTVALLSICIRKPPNCLSSTIQKLRPKAKCMSN